MFSIVLPAGLVLVLVVLHTGTGGGSGGRPPLETQRQAPVQLLVAAA